MEIWHITADNHRLDYQTANYRQILMVIYYKAVFSLSSVKVLSSYITNELLNDLHLDT